MDIATQLTAYQQIINKAKRAGLIRYDRHGVLILEQPDAAKQPAPIATATPPAAAPAMPPPSAN